VRVGRCGTGVTERWRGKFSTACEQRTSPEQALRCLQNRVGRPMPKCKNAQPLPSKGWRTDKLREEPPSEQDSCGCFHCHKTYKKYTRTADRAAFHRAKVKDPKACHPSERNRRRRFNTVPGVWKKGRAVPSQNHPVSTQSAKVH